MSYELAIINPRKRRKGSKGRKRPSKAQLAARRAFVAKFGKKKRVKSRRRKARKSTNAGVTIMAKRKRRRSSARKSKSVIRRRRRSTGKRHAAAGYTVGSGPIRRRKLNPRGRRRRYRRNPMGLPSLGGFMTDVKAAAIGAAGAVAINVGLSFLPLPDALKTGYVRQGVRLVGAFGLGWLASKFLGNKPWVKQATVGAMTVVLYDVARGITQNVSPEIGARLGEYEDVSLSGDLDGDEGFYDPAPVLADGAGAYLEGPDEGGDADELGAYMEGNLDGVYG